MRVLLLNSDPETSTRWAEALAARGHETFTAYLPEDAMEMLRSETFDLMIFDILVGDGSGLGVALLAEFHQPNCATMLVSNFDPEFQQELFSRLSSLKAVLGRGSPVADLVTFAESCVDDAGRIQATPNRASLPA
ncbi:hypothetical protein [Celeribacter sp.]|uniref:hypothetical protein n=1 Tax=Celeribacter sp. TaxID=1890673 RepID=UPI003A95BCBE